jgi:hypothetical protein
MLLIMKEAQLYHQKYAFPACQGQRIMESGTLEKAVCSVIRKTGSPHCSTCPLHTQTFLYVMSGVPGHLSFQCPSVHLVHLVPKSVRDGDSMGSCASRAQHGDCLLDSNLHPDRREGTVPVIPALGKSRQEDCQFEANLGYKVIPCL